MRANDSMQVNGNTLITPILFAALALLAFVVLSPRATSADGRQGRVSKARAAQPPAVQPEQSLAGDLESDRAARQNDEKMRFDVAENARRFEFDDEPLFDDGTPAYGNEFVTEGYIYPHGTLSVNAEGKVNGVNPDGSPEFPDKVIGRWICRGWHTGEGARTVTGDWVVTHQLYIFGNQLGKETIATDGLELVDVGVPIQRAIIGGTGPYAKARGEATQTMLGFNQLGGVGLRYEIKVTK